MEISANRRRRPAPNLIPGQKVWLLRRNISTTRPSSKLDVRRLGPFVVIGQIGTSAYRLALPPSMHIHPVFHVSLLEPQVANTFPDRVVAPPLPIQADGLLEFEVASIFNSRYFYRKLQYLIRWATIRPSACGSLWRICPMQHWPFKNSTKSSPLSHVLGLEPQFISRSILPTFSEHCI